jgi:hypothetical protein
LAVLIFFFVLSGHAVCRREEMPFRGKEAKENRLSVLANPTFQALEDFITVW